MSFLRLLGGSAAVVIASLTVSCSGTVRGAVITIDTELCEPGDGTGPVEYARVEVTVSRADGRGGEVTYCATFDDSDPDCAIATATGFPLVLPIQSESGMGTLDVQVSLLDGAGTVVGCASGSLVLDAPMTGTDIRWGSVIVRRACGGECQTDAMVAMGDWRPADLPAGLRCLPPTPEPETPIRRLAVGAEHACLVDNRGRAFCWGNNTSGQLGTGDSDDRNRPTFVRGLDGVVQDIAAGKAHTCAVLQNGINVNVWCWGENGDGQLGNDSEEDLDHPANAQNTAGAREIAAGPAHTCAIFGAGSVKCWGSNRAGELGNTDGDRSLVPVDVAGVSGVVQIAAGGRQGDTGARHTCALTAGEVVCWGSNGHLQVGQPAGSGGPPTAVPGLPATMSFVATGATSTCAVDGADGRVWCWGLNNGGALGRAVPMMLTVDEEPAPITSTIAAASPVTPTAPSGAVPLEPFADGDNFACFIDDAGAVQCFGTNLSGRLGSIEASTAVDPIVVPTSTTPPGTTTFHQVGVGTAFACALPDDGGLPFCWGSSTSGMSGTGSMLGILPPTQQSACE